MRILQVNSGDVGGGAERVARSLHLGFRSRGHDAWLAVGRKESTDPRVTRIPRSDTSSRTGQLRSIVDWLTEQTLGPVPGPNIVANSLDIVLRGAVADHIFGREDFRFPGSHRLLDLAVSTPDVLHLHNLHGLYFDLRELPRLSRSLPTIVTLHDAWLLSGHCAHSLSCVRWMTGCGSCPDLTLDPPVRMDATAFNWARKRSIYAQSRVFVSTPSAWLMKRVEQSILAPAILDARVIPNGIDLRIFRPGSRRDARVALQLPEDALILLTVGNRLQESVYKDFQTLRGALAILEQQPLPRSRIVLVGIGSQASTEHIGKVEVRFVPFGSEVPVAEYYRAADLYVHSALAESFSLVVAEALACGTPVVATAVGGVPELVKGLQGPLHRSLHADLSWRTTGPDEATGMLVPPGDSAALASAIQLLFDDSLRRRLGANAAVDAAARFGLDAQVESCLSWYEDILSGTADTPDRPSIRAVS